MELKKIKVNTDRYKAFLQNHPLITWSRLAKEAGVRTGLIKTYMSGKQQLKKEHYLKLLFITSNYCNDPWMIKEAKRLYLEMKESGELKNVKFKFKLK